MTTPGLPDGLHVNRSMDGGSLRIALRVTDGALALLDGAAVSGTRSRARHRTGDAWLTLTRSAGPTLRATVSLPGETRWTLSDSYVLSSDADLRDPREARRLLLAWRTLLTLPDDEPERQRALRERMDAAADRTVLWWRAASGGPDCERSFDFRWACPLMPDPRVTGHMVGAHAPDHAGNAALAGHPALRDAPMAATIVVNRGLRIVAGHTHRAAVGRLPVIDAMRALRDPLVAHPTGTIP